MGLTRRVRKMGDSLGVGIPSQLAVMLEVREGDALEWEVSDTRAGILRAVILRKPR